MTPAPTPFCPQQLREFLGSLPPSPRWWVGYSGGADSTALLLACEEIAAEIGQEIGAIHVNHGLHTEADVWQEHCRAFCEQRGIPFETRSVTVDSGADSGPEAAAREQRYDAISRIMAADEITLVAHHADDQAETLLLNLMRGSGVDGLAAAPALRRLGQGWLARPMLGVRRSALREWLSTRQADWIEDSTNRDESMDRNWLRHQVIPLLNHRFPDAPGRMNRSTQHARGASEFINDAADKWLAESDTTTLDGARLLEEPEFAQSAFLRRWIQSQGAPPVPVARLREFLRQLGSRSPGAIQLSWQNWSLRQHRGQLWIQRGPDPVLPAEERWRPSYSHRMDHGIGTLEFQPGKLQFTSFAVGPFQPGDRLRLLPNGPRREIRRLLQEQSVPPWLRAAVPVLRLDDQPIAVGDGLIEVGLKDQLNQHGARLSWKPQDPSLKIVASRLRVAVSRVDPFGTVG